MTNNEKINAMSVEEKAELFTRDTCSTMCVCGCVDGYCDERFSCIKGIMLWLNSEVENNG